MKSMICLKTVYVGKGPCGYHMSYFFSVECFHLKPTSALLCRFATHPHLLWPTLLLRDALKTLYLMSQHFTKTEIICLAPKNLNVLLLEICKHFPVQKSLHKGPLQGTLPCWTDMLRLLSTPGAFALVAPRVFDQESTCKSTQPLFFQELRWYDSCPSSSNGGLSVFFYISDRSVE